MVLAQRMTLPAIRHEDAAQVLVAVDVDAHQIVRFAFVPACDGIYARHRGYVRCRLIEIHRQVDLRLAVDDRRQVIQHAEAGAAGPVVDRGAKLEAVEARRRLGAQVVHRRGELVAAQLERQDVAGRFVARHRTHLGGEARLDSLEPGHVGTRR